ncbi:MAG: DUF3892 domain-containing protein [Gammaproteobacteria bacterium]|nr:DUF3892 domain-containing protein [Gammaproteobacteria bacterium]MYD80987.1 DUF3892 domain-containing protein [Gammaproteobacteria bacterium]
MKRLKLLTGATLAVLFAIHSTAHPGPETHPTVADLDDAVERLQSEISEIENRVNDRIEGLEALISGLDVEAITNTVQSEMGESVAEVLQSTNDLKDQLQQISAQQGLPKWFAGLPNWLVSAALIFWSLGAAGGLYVPIESAARAWMKHRAKSHAQANSSKEASADSVDDKEQEDEEEKSNNKRIVTHTKKRRLTKKILELHNPAEEWKSRRVEDAIDDIQSKNIVYFSRGPLGIESLIEVKDRKAGKPYLATKADKTKGNNLRELPDP